MKPEDVKACVDEQNRNGPNGASKFFPTTRRYRIDFLFDGHHYKVAPASEATARIFADH